MLLLRRWRVRARVPLLQADQGPGRARARAASVRDGAALALAAGADGACGIARDGRNADVCRFARATTESLPPAGAAVCLENLARGLRHRCAPAESRPTRSH